ncbi:hypothetical protein ACFU0X_20440 [Streptomyces cellulosae]|uniref:Uncharacterized protein n=1 Tax=Streptomyces cellulosae TaxID=1968 RepID=A0ABW6JLW3_STRCE
MYNPIISTALRTIDMTATYVATTEYEENGTPRSASSVVSGDLVRHYVTLSAKGKQSSVCVVDGEISILTTLGGQPVVLTYRKEG